MKKWKKIICFILCFTMMYSAMSVCIFASDNSDAVYYDGVWGYRVVDGYAVMVGVSEVQTGEVCGPPSYLGGYPLKVISGVNCGALAGIRTSQFIIPKGVERITQAAFNTAGMTSVVIPLSLKTVDFNSFPNCYSFNTVYYEGTVDDWSNISISYPGLSNAPLVNATRHYNYIYESDLILDEVRYFQGNAYQIINGAVSWDAAKAYCEKQGGHLATITSSEENSFLANLITKSPSTFWIGAKIDDTEWTWITGEKWNYTNWAVGEPAFEDDGTVGRITGDCDVKTIFGQHYVFNRGEWNACIHTDATAHSVKLTGFVCEWENAQRYPDGYDPLKDKYPFTNPAHSISYDKIYNLFGALWGSILYPWKSDIGNNGTCYGMAVTTGSLLKGYCSLDDISYLDEQGNKANPSCIHDVWNGSANHQDFYIDSLRMRVSDYIDYGFVYQWGPWELLIDNNVVDDIEGISVKNRLKNIYDDVYDYVYNDGEPVVINMLKNGSDGHAVLATGLSDGCTKDGEQYTEILIDDSNYLEERSIFLFKDELGEYYDWYFEFEPGDIFKAKNAMIQGCNPCNMFSVAMKKMVLYGNVYNLCEDYRLILVEKDISVENVSDLVRRHILWVPVAGCDSTENNSEQSETTEQLYWMDRSYTEPLSFSTNDKSGCVEYANYESAVTINLPADSTCNMNTDEDDYIIFTMTDTANKDIEFTHTTIDANGETVSLTVKGTAFSDVIGTETSDGVQVTGLNDITVTLETADGSAETSAKVTDGETVNITVDDPNNTVTTDWQCKHPDDNHDGICDNCGEDFTKDCDCFCHSESKFMQFIYKIVRFLWKLFGIEDRHFCACGKAHW